MDGSLAALDGLRADRLLDYAYHELRCSESIVRPNEVGRMAMQEAVLRWYDQDPEEAIRWSWAALETLGPAAPWPEVTPAGLLVAMADNPLPEESGPEGLGLLPPERGGAYLRNGYFLDSPTAPVRVPALVQAASKRGHVLETRWQDGSAFDDAWLGPLTERPTPPRWYVPPTPPAHVEPVSAQPHDREAVTVRWDTETECAWRGAPRRVSATGREVLVNRQVFPVRTDTDQRAFVRTLRACGEFRAARRFKRWRDARKKLSLQSAAQRRSMEKALLTPEPTRRGRKRTD